MSPFCHASLRVVTVRVTLQELSPKPAANAESGYIGESKAKQIALAHAGVSEGSIREFECELDREDGIMVYEIDFECGNYEYEYEINAATGEIVKYDIEEE